MNTNQDGRKNGGFAADRERAREAGRKGGEALRDKNGKLYFQTIGASGGKSLARQYGAAHMAEIGRKGGQNKGVNRSAAQKSSARPSGK